MERSIPAIKQNPQILFLDDDDQIALLCNRMLQGIGLTMITTGTIAQALWLMTVQRFDLVICDIGLPDGNGLDFLAQYIAAFPDTPAMVITGRLGLQNERRAAKLGVKHFLQKPFEVHKFREAVTSALESDPVKPAAVKRKRRT